MAAHDDGGESVSIAGVSIAVGAVMTFLLWGVACAMYDAARPKIADIAAIDDEVDGRPVRVRGRAGALAFGVAGVATFLSKSFSMLPEMPAVLGFVFRERLWFAVTAALVLGGVVLFGVFLKRTEAALATPYHKRKRRRR
ncbi:MAG TPA: hypothetical protein VM452_08050 [Caulifigura sp.]|jgi:hypothetical protein|nr:hypothetical protein [Caulifigura sp.]